MRLRTASSFLLLLALPHLVACAKTEPRAAGEAASGRRASVVRAPFGVLPGGDSVHVFTVTNAHGIELRAIDYGSIIVTLRTPDRTGRLDDIVLGYDSLSGYLRSTPYFGAIVGRYANRIARGRFTLGDTVYRLAINNGPNALHGGLRGFDKVVWNAQPFSNDTSAGVILSYVSRNGEEGYPGTLSARVTYTLDDRDRLSFEYEATSDKPTPVNLTQHTYFNLAGGASRDILGHVLMLAADRYTPVDSTLIPTGELAPVAGTPFDFRTPTVIGQRIDEPDPQLRNGRGYDHNFVLTRADTGLIHFAHVEEPTNGRTLDVETTQPGVQFYTGNFLDGSITGKGGRVYARRFGFCLETQHFPDSPNEPLFPTTILRPGEQYRSRTVFSFGVAK